jgi:hypothetical protein
MSRTTVRKLMLTVYGKIIDNCLNLMRMIIHYLKDNRDFVFMVLYAQAVDSKLMTMTRFLHCRGKTPWSSSGRLGAEIVAVRLTYVS